MLALPAWPGRAESGPQPKSPDTATCASLGCKDNSLVLNPFARVRPHHKCRPAVLSRPLPFRLRLAMQRLRRGRPPAPFPGAQVHCPEPPEKQFVHPFLHRFLDRALQGLCNSPQGMWQDLETVEASMCKYRSVARLFGLRPGMRVLDLGAGCGHQLHFIGKRYGIRGTGVEYLPSNVAYAQKHLGLDPYHDSFCVGDLKEPLHFLPNASFDVVIASGVLSDLSGGEQCRVVRTSARLLAPGGCAWFGFLHESRTDIEGKVAINKMFRWMWSEPGCLSGVAGPSRGRRSRHRQPHGLTFATVRESRFFGVAEYNMTSVYSLFLCKSRNGPWKQRRDVF